MTTEELLAGVKARYSAVDVGGVMRGGDPEVLRMAEIIEGHTDAIKRRDELHTAMKDAARLQAVKIGEEIEESRRLKRQLEKSERKLNRLVMACAALYVAIKQIHANPISGTIKQKADVETALEVFISRNGINIANRSEMIAK